MTGATGVERSNSYCEAHRAEAAGRQASAPVPVGGRAALRFGRSAA